MTPAYFAQVSPTYIENWSDALVELSIPQTDIPLTPAETRALAHRNSGGGAVDSDTNDYQESIDKVIEKLGTALCAYGQGAFVRLGSRSGKDSRFAKRHGLKIFQADDALRMLTEGSRRVAFDLRLAQRCDYQPHIFVREWYEIEAWAEFRCFMKRRELVGISQYDCKNFGHSAEIAANAERIQATIESFFVQLRAASHLDDVVFDVFLDRRQDISADNLKVKLLELNPFLPQTDACLFDWSNGGDFDGSFRYL